MIITPFVFQISMSCHKPIPTLLVLLARVVPRIGDLPVRTITHGACRMRGSDIGELLVDFGMKCAPPTTSAQP